MHRRTFLACALTLPAMRASRAAAQLDLAGIERTRVLKAANKYLGEAPVTVTAARSPRSAGGKHDFFSEGDYWWPDPANPRGRVACRRKGVCPRDYCCGSVFQFLPLNAPRTMANSMETPRCLDR